MEMVDGNLPSEPVVLIASAEFTLKSYPVRRTLEQRLIDDLRTALKDASVDGANIEKHAARLVVRRVRDALSAARVCARVFGVAYAAPAVMLPASIEPITQQILKTAEEEIHPGQSFAIRTHRSTKTSVSRRDLEIRGGSEVLNHLKSRDVRVDLTQPDVTISVDLADDRAYVYSQKLEGPSGLPISAHWKLLGILDSGPLSILAAYAMMRRGCLVELLIPTSEKIKNFDREEQLRMARALRRFVTRPNYRVHLLQLEKLLGGGSRSDASDLASVRGLVRKAALQFAKKKHFKGIVIPDVAGVIDAHLTESQVPIFHPLIGLDGNDLMDVCRAVGISQEELSSQIELENRSTGTFHESVSNRDFSDVEPEQLLL